MKNLILSLLLVSSVSIFGCSKNKEHGHETEIVNLEVKLIDGSWTTASFKLPVGSRLYVNTFRGSYELRFDNPNCELFGCRGELKAAVIDFKKVR
jgi:hypothetical protein